MGETDYQRLLNQAFGMKTSTAKLSLLEEVVRAADSAGDIESAVAARFELMHTAAFCGAIDHLLVAFTWCLAQFDRASDSVSERELLWSAKWVVDFLESLPSISRDRINSLTDDVEARFLNAGFSVRPITLLRFLAAAAAADPLAMDFRQKWLTQSRDSLADCAACEDGKVGEALFHLGRYEEGLDELDAVLQQRRTCSSQPNLSYGRVLLPLIRLGRLDEAETYHSVGYRKVAGNPLYLETVGQHLKYLVYRGDLEKGIRILERHVRIALAAVSATGRLEFYTASSWLLESVHRRSRTGKRKLRLPQDFPVAASDDGYLLADVRDWFESQGHDVAEQFDRRNGNDRYRQSLQEQRELLLGG